METAAVIGLGDMGSGLAKNLLANGFSVRGYDLSASGMNTFANLGGTPCANVTSAAEGADLYSSWS